jgi:hypothetical protein
MIQAGLGVAGAAGLWLGDYGWNQMLPKKKEEREAATSALDLQGLISPVADVQGWGKSPWGQINSLWGGSRPIANILAGGALGATGGFLGEQLLPKEEFERGRLRRSGALLGAAFGVAPGAWHLYDALRQGVSPLAPWPPKMRPDPSTAISLPSSAKQAYALEIVDEHLTQVLGPSEDECLNCFYPRSAYYNYSGSYYYHTLLSKC